MLALVLLRVVIGWHILYEGVAKLLNPGWSAAGFLVQSRGMFAGVFRWMAERPDVMSVVNPLNKWGLTCIGLGLILGCFTRLASAAGMVVIGVYYLCNPPLVGYFYSIPMEGNYLVVNKNLVEMAALFVTLVTNSGRHMGLDRILHAWVHKGRRQTHR
jgi:thiosulfate dehydrogenase [quinone] large subunit